MIFSHVMIGRDGSPYACYCLLGRDHRADVDDGHLPPDPEEGDMGG